MPVPRRRAVWRKHFAGGRLHGACPSPSRQGVCLREGSKRPGLRLRGVALPHFQYAHILLAPGGVIAVLDSGEYFPVTINKSLSIINDGAGTSLVRAAFGQAAITITAAADDKVLLRALTADGGGRGSNGLRFNAGFRLCVSNCV